MLCWEIKLWHSEYYTLYKPENLAVINFIFGGAAKISILAVKFSGILKYIKDWDRGKLQYQHIV